VCVSCKWSRSHVARCCREGSTDFSLATSLTIAMCPPMLGRRSYSSQGLLNIFCSNPIIIIFLVSALCKSSPWLPTQSASSIPRRLAHVVQRSFFRVPRYLSIQSAPMSAEDLISDLHRIKFSSSCRIDDYSFSDHHISPLQLSIHGTSLLNSGKDTRFGQILLFFAS
jgi:hypothetical protein